MLTDPSVVVVIVLKKMHSIRKNADLGLIIVGAWRPKQLRGEIRINCSGSTQPPFVSSADVKMHVSIIYLASRSSDRRSFDAVVSSVCKISQTKRILEHTPKLFLVRT